MGQPSTTSLGFAPRYNGRMRGIAKPDEVVGNVAHVVATKIHGQEVASGYTQPDGTYRIDGSPPAVYVAHAERLGGPLRPLNIAGFREGFGAETTDHETTFHR